jgi:hypothetical protein
MDSVVDRNTTRDPAWLADFDARKFVVDEDRWPALFSDSVLRFEIILVV